MNIEERFKLVYPRIQKIARKYSTAYPVPYEEYESMMCEEFIKIDESFNAKVNNSYKAYVGAKLDQVALRMSGASRKERRFHDVVVPIDIPEDVDDDVRYPTELVDDVDVEEQVFDVMFVEELLANADDKTRMILEEFFANPHASFREIARALGLNDKLVKRRLEAVAEGVRQT